MMEDGNKEIEPENLIMKPVFKIFKYQLAILEKQVIQLPKDAKILRVDDVEGKIYLWAIVEVGAQLENRYLACYKTGMEIDRDIANLQYLGFAKLYIIQELGLYFFEETNMKGIV